MYLNILDIDKKVYILGPTDENIKPLKPFQKLYLILRHNIVITHTLCTLSVATTFTDFCTDKVQNCTDNFILSARVRGPLVIRISS